MALFRLILLRDRYNTSRRWWLYFHVNSFIYTIERTFFIRAVKSTGKFVPLAAFFIFLSCLRVKTHLVSTFSTFMNTSSFSRYLNELFTKHHSSPSFLERSN